MKRFINTCLLITLIWVNPSLYSFSDTKSLFEQATGALNSGNYGSSELLFKKIIDTDDDEFKDKAQFYHAKSIFLQKKYRSAIYEFNSYLNSCRTPALCIQSRFWIAESYHFLKEDTKAIEEYKRYIQKSRKNSMSASAHDRIAQIYYSEKRYDEAVIEWTEAIKSSDDREKNAIRVVQTGEALFLSKKYDEALNRLSPILTSNSRTGTIAQARIISGRVYQLKGNHNKAIKLFNGVSEELVRKKPYYDVHYFRTLSYLKTNRMNSAKNQLNLFIHIASESEWFYDALYELARIYNSNRKEDKSIKLLKEVYDKTDKKNLKIKASIILTELLIKKKPSDAILYLKESLRTGESEDQNKILLLLGKAYISTKQFNEAEKILTEYIEKYPFDKNIDEVNFLMARIQLEKGNENSALQLLQKLQDENPFSKYLNESNYYLALVNYRKENFTKSVELLKKYLSSKKPQSVYEANILLLNSYIKLKYFRSASFVVRNLIKKYSDKKDIEKYIFSYAIAAEKEGKNSDYFFNYITRKYPKTETAYSVYLFLGSRWFEQKKYTKAAEYYKLYLQGKLDKDRGTAYYNRLISLYMSGKYNEVISIIRKGGMPPMEEDRWQEIPLLLSRSYYKTGNYSRVYQIMYSEDFNIYKPSDLIIFVESSFLVNDLESAQKAGEILSDNKKFYSKYLFYSGEYFTKKKLIDKSIFYYSKLIDEFSDTDLSEKAKLKLAEIYFNRKEYSKSIDLLNLIKSDKLIKKKIYLLVKAYFLSDNNKEALKVTAKNIRSILRGRYAEEILKLNLEYYFKEKNIRMFNRYAYYLKKQPGTKAYINLRYAELYQIKRNYKKAYYHFYRLSVLKSDFRQKAFYGLARINLFVYRNKKNAVRYFKKAINEKSSSEDILQDSLLNLAIIYIEMQKKNDAIEIFQRISERNKKRIYLSRVRNLMIHFGISETEISGRKGI